MKKIPILFLVFFMPTATFGEFARFTDKWNLGDEDPVQWCSVDGETYYYKDVRK